MTKPHFVPKLHHTITPTLTVRDALGAIDFYKRAFGAQEISCMKSPDGKKVMHAEIRIGDSMIMLNDEMPEMNCPSPETLKGVASSLFMYVENCDETFKRAVDCGATSIMAPVDMFWGDRFSKLSDPFGQQWSIATHIEDLNEKEIAERGNAFFAAAAAH
ncbi:MAG TPA: VOC family protein [Drouetiella sp.]